MEIKHPLKFNKLYPIQEVLVDLASRENCDGESYDQMMEASEYISELEKNLVNVELRLKEAHRREEHLLEWVTELRRKLFVTFNEDECWVWDADNIEDNHIDSLVCPVVICPKVLKSYLEGNNVHTKEGLGDE